MKGTLVWKRVLALAILMIATAAAAQVPGEITGVVFDGATILEWNPVVSYDFYNVYRGSLGELTSGTPPRCHQFELSTADADVVEVPASGETWLYLVVGERVGNGEGSAGLDSGGGPRALLGACIPKMRHHVLNRLGYGWNEWSRDRLAALGLAGYVAEQLDPALIDESTNVDLNDRLEPIDPPVDIFQIIQQRSIRGVYARRQLEQQAAAFVANHFNTDWQKVANVFQGVFPQCVTPGNPPQCDANFPSKAYEAATGRLYNEIETFRAQSFGGSFREMVESSATSLAMIIYLDTYLSVVGSPNENYPRELMELHAMGVDGGYTQADVEELSRVITGWTGCKKTLANADDPLAPCIEQYWLDTPAGEWVAAFVPTQHDCTSKTLFAGTPHEAVIPDTCAFPNDGVDDLYLALDAIVAHPATADFISRKILQRFVTDEPEQALLDALIAEWNDATNPAGVGDIRAMLEAALTSGAFLDPARTGSKIKTPLEHMISAMRATRGRTDGLDPIVSYLVSMGHIPHYNPVPTGWPEDGESWIDTNNTLDRQNFGFTLISSGIPAFGAEPIQLLNDNGVSTAPGNAEAIVEFFADVLYGTTLTPAERQEAIDYLSTDDFGNPTPYNDVRILETVGFMLGYPHFQEQ